jgi:hypothetical protein
MLIQGDNVRGTALRGLVEPNDLRRKIVRGFRRIQSNYGQTEYGINSLVVGDIRGDGENPRRR